MIAAASDWMLPWLDAEEQFWSNNFLHLALVLGALIALQVILMYRNWLRTRRARKRIPLVIGGWGTRGKSSTERCKAAIFAAFGADTVTKTTGSEATFMHSLPGMPAEEIPLLRPMDRATIQEQRTLVDTASTMDAEVFCYECMALNPRYVEVIQDGWMQDDLTTITNAFPDHENIQGPSGRNIAEAIGAFTPRGRRTFTSEQQMLPILREVARERNGRVRAASWLDAALLTNDVVSRFPYREHPANIALVLSLARHLGLEDDFVLKSMADHVVPDLGVLRTYPTIFAKGRSLSFTNGMSANERTGALDNWRRLGFDRTKPRSNPDQWTICVVNNRRDRAARSRAFAELLSSDIMPHAILLIGEQLESFHHLLEQAHKTQADQWRVTGCENDNQLQDRLHTLMDKVKLEARDPGALDTRVGRLLAGCGMPGSQVRSFLTSAIWRQSVAAAQMVMGTADDRTERNLTEAWSTHAQTISDILTNRWPQGSDSDRDHVQVSEVMPHIERWWCELRCITSLTLQFLDRLGHLDATDDAAAAGFFISQALDRVFILDNPRASGDQVISAIIDLAPPGFDLLALGMQNIKGAGLDFAYRWAGILRVKNWCDSLDDPSHNRRIAAVRALSSYGDYHYYDARLALAACRAAVNQQAWHGQEDRQVLRQCIAAIESALAQGEQDLFTPQRKRRWWHIAITLSEPIIDLVDAAWRRHRHRQILRRLADGRMSHVRAATRLRELVERQKGNWLNDQLRRWFGRVQAEVTGGQATTIQRDRMVYNERDHRDRMRSLSGS